MSDTAEKQGRSFVAYLVPFIFFALVAVFAIMLTREGRNAATLPSALIGQVMPTTPLPPIPGLTAADGTPMGGFDPALFEGKITLMNVWASWCAPCRDEHPYLTQLADDPRVQLVGLNYKDRTNNAISFLSNLGNPYDAIGTDNSGRAAIEWGVYGVPETFIVGPDGVIEYKFAGPINAEIIAREFLPRIEALAQAQ